MLDPYRMVVVNIFSSIALICGILFYRFVFPKHKINLLFLLILISILPIISIFRNGTYESGDFNIHIYRAMSFYDSLKEGNLMPSWAKDLNATYGYPLFIFNYPLPYYFISFFHFIGFSFITSLKIFIAINLVFSGVFMYFFTKVLFKNSLAAFTSAVFYIFTPYHLIDIHFKVTIGEIMAFTLIPLIFLFIHKLYKTKSLIYVAWSSISFATLIMTNGLVAFFVAPLMFTYVVFLTIENKLNSKYLLHAIPIFLISAILSVHIWLAPVIYRDYLYIQKAPLVIGYSPKLPELIYSPYRWGFLFQGPTGQIPFLIGYTQLFVLMATTLLFLLKRRSTKILNGRKFWLLISFIVIFLITPYSRFLWEYFSFAKAAGSHRLLLPLTFSVSILAGYFSLNFIKKKPLLTLLIITTIGYTILNWGHRRVISEITDNVLKQNLWKSTSEGEGHYYANTKWADIKQPWFSKLPKSNIEILKGHGEIKSVKRQSTKHKYIIHVKTPLLIKENTLYFPGWSASINGKELALYPSTKGIIHFSVPKGLYELEIIYEDIYIYKLLKFISLLSLAGVSIFIILKLFSSNNKKIRSYFFILFNVF